MQLCFKGKGAQSAILPDDPNTANEFQTYLGGGARGARADGPQHNGYVDMAHVVAVQSGELPANLVNRWVRVLFAGREQYQEFPVHSGDFQGAALTPDARFREFLNNNGNRCFSYSRAGYRLVLDFEAAVYVVYRQ